jgi:diguanylate cyclase (GGDEF)-like protein
LAKCVRKHDLVARLGGDEFAIIQPGVKSQEEAERLTKRLLRAISEPSRVLGHEISTSASIGVVLAPEHGTSSLELIKNVYLALYAAKAAGRDTHRIFETRRADGPVERCDVRASPTNPPPNE